MLKKVIRAIFSVVQRDIMKMFQDKWEYLELGSSQADLVESYVLKTIWESLEKELK